MAARNQVKTIVPRAHNTLDGYSEIKERRATQVFPHFWLTQSYKPHPSWLTMGLLGLVKVLLYDRTDRAPHISLSIQWLEMTVSSKDLNATLE